MYVPTTYMYLCTLILIYYISVYLQLLDVAFITSFAIVNTGKRLNREMQPRVVVTLLLILTFCVLNLLSYKTSLSGKFDASLPVKTCVLLTDVMLVLAGVVTAGLSIASGWHFA